MHDAFSAPIPFSYVRDSGKPFVIIFSLSDLDLLDIYSDKIVKSLPINTSYNVFIKLRYFNDNFCMTGSQFGFNYNNQVQIESLFDIVKSRIATTFDVYNMTNADIVYIQLTFRKLDVKLLADFTLDKNSIVNNTMTNSEFNTITSSTNIPVSINEHYLGLSLKVTFVDNIVTYIYVTLGNEAINFLDKIKAQSKLYPNGHKDKITSFDSSFRFYLTYINEKHYVLGIKYIDSNKVIKISYFLNGVLDKYVTDTLLSQNIVSRSYGNMEFLINNNNVVYSKQALMIRAISKPKFAYLAGGTPNIGVIYLETFRDTGDKVKVYAAGFKTNLVDAPTIYYL